MCYDKTVRRIGFHTSIAGGIHKSLQKAVETGCNTLQIFSHNPRGWAISPRDQDETRLFRELKTTLDITPIFIHTSYLINLASKNKDLLKKSVAMVIREMDIADEVGADYVVLHTGSASGDNPDTARKRAAASLRSISETGTWKARLLLENTAGERGDITSSVRDLSELLETVPGNLIAGICLDTCHAFSAGYDISSEKGINELIAEADKYVGSTRIKLLHLNDSKGQAGSGIDRHEHIGKGHIGVKGFKLLLKSPFFSGIPIILETPKKSEDDDLKNLRTLKKIIE